MRTKWFLLGLGLVATAVIALLPERRNPIKRTLRVRRMQRLVRTGQMHDGLHLVMH